MNKKPNFFDAVVVVGAVVAAAATTYCYPNKITQNLISLLQQNKSGIVT